MLMLKYIDSYVGSNLQTNNTIQLVCELFRNLISLYGAYIGAQSLYEYYQYNTLDQFEYGGLQIIKTMMFLAP